MGGEHRVSNGILLRAGIYQNLDHGYVTITPDYVDKPIRRPDHPGDRPDRQLLEEHNDTVFLG